MYNIGFLLSFCCTGATRQQNSNLTGLIPITETGSTTSRAYNFGEVIRYGNNLYVAAQNIAQGTNINYAIIVGYFVATNVVSKINGLNNNLNTKLNCTKNGSMEIVFGSWTMTVNANSTTSDGGALAAAIREWTGWSTTYILIPILQTNLPIYLTVQGDVIYAHNTKSETYENVTIKYIALGIK